MSGNSHYSPKIGAVSVNWCGCYIVPLGEYRIVVLHPDSFLRRSCLGVKTLLVPKGKAIATFIFIAICFFTLEWLAQQFASRQLTPLQLFLDGGLAFGTINAGISTSVSDPGILPPELASPDDDDDDGNNNDDDNMNSNNNTRQSQQPAANRGLKRRVASIDNLFEEESSSSDPLARSSLNPYLVAAGEKDGSNKAYIEDNDNFKLSNCKYCKHVRPKACGHCPRCHCCILGFDHHCGFLQMDIGERNLRHFIIFIVHCFLCVANAAGAFLKPWFFLIFFKNEDLIENAPRRSYLVLGVMSIVLVAWAVILFYMALNYLIMAFVPGSRSTRDVWRKWCGKANNNTSSLPQAKNDPLPEWHPGYKQQQRDLEEKEKENSEIKACKILFGVKPSLLPAWTDDLFSFGGSLSPENNNNDEADDKNLVADDREELKVITTTSSSSSSNKH